MVRRHGPPLRCEDGLDIHRRALTFAAALFLLTGTAAAAPFALPGAACSGYALERRGDDLALTCPGPWQFYTSAPRRTWVTLRGWYTLCAYHVVLHAPGGDTIYCALPVRR